jgi:hypothetical protein
VCWLAVGCALGEYDRTNPNSLGLWASHLKPLASMSEVPTRIRALEGPDLRHQVNSSDTPENELR